MIKSISATFALVLFLMPNASLSETLKLRVTGGEIVKDRTLIFSSEPIEQPIPLVPGTLIEAEFDPARNEVHFDTIELRVITDEYDQAGDPTSPFRPPTTGPRDIRLSLHNFPFIPVGSNGDLSGAQFGYWIQEWPEFGGQGHIQIYTLTGSKFVDDDPAGLNLTNGLGLAGKLVFKLFSGESPHKTFEVNVEAREIRKRNFEVLYDPPIIKVIFPGPLQSPHLSRQFKSKTLTIDELIEAATEVSGSRDVSRKSRALTFENVSSVQLLLLDDQDLVLGGDFSDSSEKTLRLPQDNRQNIRVLALPRSDFSETSTDVQVDE